MNLQKFPTLPQKGSGSRLIVRGIQVASLGVLASVFAMPMLGQTNACFDVTSGLVAWWRAEGNAIDQTGEHNGTFPFGSAFASGVVGQAFDFDGSYRRVSIPDDPAFILTNAFTVEAWIYPRAHEGFVSFRGDNRPGLDAWSLDLYDTGYVKCQIDDVSNNAQMVRAPVTLNTWHHVAATWERVSGSMMIYLNGVLVQQTNTSLIPIGALDPASEPALGIGNHGGTFHQFPFNGLIDELAIFNQALTSNQIAQIYSAGSAGKCLSTNPPVLAAAPSITSISPQVAIAGTQVIVAGTNFGANPSNNIVYFGSIRAEVVAATHTNILVRVPPGATYAPVSVTVAGLTALSPRPFLPTFASSSTNLTSMSFAPGQNLSVADGPLETVIADLDGDGKPDLIEANAYAHNFSLFRNVSVAGVLDSSSFAPRVDFPSLGGTDSPRCIAVADVDGDGRLDIIVGDQANSGVWVYQNLATPGSIGVASFASPLNFAAGGYPHGIQVSDLNADGRPEILVASHGVNSLFILENVGTPGTLTSSSFAPSFALPTGSGPVDVAVADLNGDLKPDLVTTAFDGTELSVYRNVAAPGNTLSNWFVLDTTLPALPGALEIKVADLDGDSKSDLIVASVQGYAISVYRNQSAPGAFTTNSFGAKVDFAMPGWAHNLAIADFNGDLKPDLAVVGELDSYLAVLENRSAPGGFTADSLAPRLDFPTGWNAWGVAAGDLDGDQRPDLVFANTYDDTLTFYRNVVSIGSSNPSPVCVEVPAGLISWWRAEGNLNDSESHNDGTATNPNIISTQGRVGTAFQFNGGGDRIELGDPASLRLTNSFTIEAWIFPSNTPSGPHSQILFRGDMRGCLDPYYFSLQPSRAIRLHIAANDPDNPCGVDLETAPISLLEWKHVAGVFDGNAGQMRIYIDGNLAAQTNTSIRPFADLDSNYSPGVAIGNHSQGFSDQGFNGMIDELSVYGRALAANEIAAIYLAGAFGKCPLTNPPVTCTTPPVGLVGWWRGDNNYLDQVSLSFATVTGGVSIVSGVVGEAMTFNGTDAYLEVSNSPQLTLTSELTIEFWAKRQRFGDLIEYAVEKGGDWTAGQQNYGVVLNRQSYNHCLSFHFAGGWRGAGGINDTNWHHCAVVARNGDVDPMFYIDGVLQSVTYRYGAGTINLYPSSRPLHIGAQIDPFSGWNYFSQLEMDEVSICSRALAADEIQTVFAAGSAGKCASSNLPPAITQQPQSQTVPANTLAQLTVAVTSVPYPFFQWYFNGDLLIGATNNPLVLSSVQTNHSGNYFVVVSNPFGVVTSAVATLTVEANPPVITLEPQDQNVYPGSTANFGVRATGAKPLYYQWYYNGQSLRSGSSSNLTLINVQSNMAGAYQAIVWNPFGSVTSRVAVLTVAPPAPCAEIPAGAVAWWPFESNTWDVISGYDAVLNQSPPASLLYSTGEVNAAFNPSYTGTYAMVPAGYGLNVNGGSGLTIEGWIRPNTYSVGPIAEWNDGRGRVGAGLILNTTGPGVIEATLTDTNPPISTVTIRSTPYAITNSVWQHVALTLDQDAGVASLYVNGQLVAQLNNDVLKAGFNPLTQTDFYMGYRRSGSYGGTRFNGALDEITLYNRALSPAELQSIVAADTTGKCPGSPLACTPAPNGIVAWWRGESNTVDSVAGNNGMLIPTNYPASYIYSTGQVGSAFFIRPPAFVTIPPSDGLDVGSGDGLTVEGWIYPNYLTPMPIVEWTDTNSYGASLWLSYYRGPTVLEANFIDKNGGFHLLRSPSGAIRGYSWQHVAATYEKSTGVGALYVDGLLVTSTNMGYFTPRTDQSLLLGFHPHATTTSGDGSPPPVDYRFNGLIDELAIYRRALSGLEIRNLVRSRPGKCLELPPTIGRNPTDEIALEGGAVQFSVVAGGSEPLRYQWLLDANPIPDATNFTLNLSPVQLADAGEFSVVVTNDYGSVTSRTANLTVLPVGQCLPTPLGAVAFWRGESNTVDELGNNPAQWPTNVSPSYTSPQTGGAVVGTGFRLNGQNQHLFVPTSPELNVGAGGGFTVEGWIKPDIVGGIQPIFDWNDGKANVGVGLMLGRTGPGSLEVTITDTNATLSNQRSLTLTSPNFTIGTVTNLIPSWTHVAVTFDKAAAQLILFVNGVLVAQRGTPPVYVSASGYRLFSPATTGNLTFGWRPSGIYSGPRFRGAMDELTVYYRALTPNEIKSIFVAKSNGKCTPAPACQPLAAGIKSWWRAESNTLDSVGISRGQFVSQSSYNDGVVGAAFRMGSGYVQITNLPALSPGTGLTFETWFKLDQASSPFVLASWNHLPNNQQITYQGVSIGTSPTRGPNYFEANLVDESGISHALTWYTYTPALPGTLIPAQVWHHLAVTYDKPSGQAVLYLNGSPVVSTNLGVFTPRTSGSLNFGRRPNGSYPGSGQVLAGDMDEVLLYDRALSAGEITASFRNNANRCMEPPVIVEPPPNVKVNPGSNVSLEVVARGNPLLRYQWGFVSWSSQYTVSTVLQGQTNSTLSLTNVNSKVAGLYWVLVTNNFGGALSSNTILTVNSAPIATTRTLATLEDTPTNVILTGYDVDRDPLTVIVLAQPQHGTLAGSGSNFLYTPNLNYFGPDSFTYKVNDGLLDSAPATVSITVAPVNDPPMAASQSVATDEDTPLPITLIASDVDGDELTYNITPPSHGTLTGTAPDLVYKPNANYFGDDVFTYTVKDPSNAVSELAAVSITVRPVNDPPQAKIIVVPLEELPGVTNLISIAGACCNATLRLDASQSSDVENDVLEFAWLEGTNVLSSAMVFSNQFAPGSHQITLLVSDGSDVGLASVTVEVITPAEAVDYLKTLVELGLSDRNDRVPLVNWLREAAAGYERCDASLGNRMLTFFIGRVQERVLPGDPQLADALIKTATAIGKASADCNSTDRLGRGRNQPNPRGQGNGRDSAAPREKSGSSTNPARPEVNRPTTIAPPISKPAPERE